ncbi:MAG: polymer-forming cytoskeletal protein [Chitinophagaceae bacterium]|nr:MAG: Integral membrane protein CcmA involved in cell shape determination [Bacteroidetes bacterium OLB11]MCC6448268.1 polymer-forming cytoskeletal protein [Chitinophagaceae bacterium]HMN32586.1 polymer-forming cytoskeletal protein [Chitinophagaceae bacterium]
MSIFSSGRDKQEPTPAPTPVPKPTPTSTPTTTTAPNYGSSSSMTNISRGTIIDGQIKVEGDIKVDGLVKGTVTAKGKVQIAQGGKVEGDIICQNAEISGHVTGKLRIAEVLMLKGNAVIDGDINTGKLMIETGVKFNGNCTMGAQVMKEQSTPITSSVGSSGTVIK